MPKLFESPLYTSNLYDSKQKSRSHLVLFENVDHNNNQSNQSNRSRSNSRQNEHSNAFGYLGCPLNKQPQNQQQHQLKRRQQIDYNRPSSANLSTAKYGGHYPRASTPPPMIIIKPTQNASSRNESSNVRAVLDIPSLNVDGDEDDLYRSIDGKFQNFARRRYTATPPPTFRTPPSQNVMMTATYKIRKQHELSPDNGSYFLTSIQQPHQPDDIQNKKTCHLSRRLLSSSSSTNRIDPIFLPMEQQQKNLEQQSDQSSQNRILIKNGKIVNDDAIFKADVYVEDGIIKDIGPHLIVPGGVKTIDANGFYVMPGGIDTHTHLDSSFMGSKTADDFYSGTRAALAGGTTTVMDFVMTQKGQNLVEAFKQRRSQSDGVACCDYVFRVIIPEFIKGKTDAEMETLVKEHGINSFKIFMAYKDSLMLKDEDIIQVMNKCRQLGALPLVHAENGDIIEYNIRKLKSMGITGPEGHILSRPEEVEAEATNRVIMLANQITCPVYIVHVNSQSAADVIARARDRGCIVYGEPIAAGIGSDGTHYFNKCWQHAAAHVMSPPLRPDKNTSKHLIDMLASGQLQTTGSDHCVFNAAEKAKGQKDFSLIPNGINGVEERLMILWEKAVRTGSLDPRQFVAVTSTNAAKLFNLYPKKGRLAKGSDADIVIWGPNPKVISAENHHFNGDFNIFEGTQVAYGPLVVISNGRVVLDENGLHVIQGSGRFLPCAPNSSYLWHSIRERERLIPLKVNRDGKDETDSNQPALPSTPNVQNGTPPIQPITPPVYPAVSEPIFKDANNTPTFYKGSTRSGVRNLQDSSFALSGAQIDDDKIGKTAIRVQNPPGGRSSGIW